MKNPSDSALTAAYKEGGVNAVEDLYYPGEREAHKRRIASFPIPEGTGRTHHPEIEYVELFYRDSGGLFEDFGFVRSETKVYFDDIYVGSIKEVMHKRYSFSHYEAHSGLKFAHWGGETGITEWIKDRHWL